MAMPLNPGPIVTVRKMGVVTGQGCLLRVAEVWTAKDMCGDKGFDQMSENTLCTMTNTRHKWAAGPKTCQQLWRVTSLIALSFPTG
jgi:hypothetical protein